LGLNFRIESMGVGRGGAKGALAPWVLNLIFSYWRFSRKMFFS